MIKKNKFETILYVAAGLSLPFFKEQVKVKQNQRQKEIKDVSIFSTNALQ